MHAHRESETSVSSHNHINKELTRQYPFENNSALIKFNQPTNQPTTLFLNAPRLDLLQAINGACDVLGFVPTDSVSNFSTL